MGNKIINTGVAVQLSALILSGDLQDANVIHVYDTHGEFVTKGRWMEDNIISRRHCSGIARKVGTGVSVSFNLV